MSDRGSATFGRPDLQLSSSNNYRDRGESTNSLTSPRRGEAAMMDRPLSTRAANQPTSPQFWVNSASYSLFSGAETPRTSNILRQLAQDAQKDAIPAAAAGSSSPTSNGVAPPGHGRIPTVVSPNFSVVMIPQQDHDAFDASLKAAEQGGEWVECRETLTGRIMWYNTVTNRLVFDNPPDGVRVITNVAVADQHELSYEDMITNRPIEPYENENVVESLLSLSTHPWEFENDQVDVYRAKAARRDHAAMLPDPDQYVFPEYFSQSPIPELPGNQFLARVRLPAEFSPFRQRVTVRVKVDYTTAADVITQAVDRLQEPHNQVKDCWVLKVVGREEYIYGRTRIVDYEAVRMAVRNESDVEFVLSQQPAMNERIEEAKMTQAESAEHFASLYPEHLRANEFLDDAMDGCGTLDTLDFSHQNKISLFECDWNFRCKIDGLTNVCNLARFDDSIRQVYLRVEVWIGRTQFEGATQRPTTPMEPRNDLRWGEYLSSNSLNFSQLPRESILCFMVFGIADTEHRCLAWSRMPLIDQRDRLRRGKYLMNMWEVPLFTKSKEGPKEDPYKELPFRYRGTTTPKNLKNQATGNQCQLLVEFDEFSFEVVAPRYPPDINYAPEEVGRALDAHEFKQKEKKKMTQILERNPLDDMKEEEKLLIWKARDILWHDPKALPVFLRSVDWTNLACVAEAHRYLGMWSPPKRVEDALEFLDYIYADTRVREFAVAHLSQMDDGDLQEFLLQLVQCLKYEPHHDSALARLLIERGLRNPYQIGHFLFWHLKAEFHELEFAERFGVIMEEYLLHAGEHSRQLFVQYNIIRRFEIIADKIAKATKTRPSAECKKLLRIELNKLNQDLPETLQIPLNPRWLAKKLNVPKCRFMSSKKVPLWLEFENADPYATDPLKIMFKSGDDLRQDILTLQVMTVMDKVWLANKLDLRMKPYSVIATGVNRHNEGVGMLEIVTRSTTINSIYNDFGLYNEASISEYIRTDHSDASNQFKSEAELQKSRENFARSCAGYCVATFVLGIGDRHSDNIMVHQMGHLFHIDFGHFLGNFKSKFGVKRERSPFVFTPQMKHAIDGGEARNSEKYMEFKQWCFDAYQVLRARNRLFINLFILMVSAGMPELMKESDIVYLKNMLNLQMDNRQAQDSMEKQINSSLRDFTRGMDNVFHNWKHRG